MWARITKFVHCQVLKQFNCINLGHITVLCFKIDDKMPKLVDDQAENTYLWSVRSAASCRSRRTLTLQHQILDPESCHGFHLPKC